MKQHKEPHSLNIRTKSFLLMFLVISSICFSFSFSQYLYGNRDSNSIVSRKFFPHIRARYIRVLPYSWYGYISMRVEFYGCFIGEFHVFLFLVHASTTESNVYLLNHLI